MPARADAPSPRYATWILVAGVVGWGVTLAGAALASSAAWLLLFVLSSLAFGVSTWYATPAEKSPESRRIMWYCVAAAVGIGDATLLTVTHASLGGLEVWIIALHYVVGAAFALVAADGIRRSTGHG